MFTPKSAQSSHRLSVFALTICSIAYFIFAVQRPLHAAISWTGTGGTSWATTTSWSPTGSGPSTSDTASFTDTGSTSILGDVTSILNADRTIGGLSFINTAGHYHTLDLATHTLLVTGNLNFNLDQNSSTVTTIRNGTLNVNGAFANINVGRAVSSAANSTVDLSGLTALNATVQGIQVGMSSANGANGTLTLSPINMINAGNIQVGISVIGQTSNGTIHLGHTNTILTNQFTIGQSYANGSVQMPSGGTLNLGSSNQLAGLIVGDSTTYTDASFAGTLDLTGGAFNAFIGNLTVGERAGGGGVGSEIGTLLGGNSGSVVIGSPASPSNVNVGRTLAGSSSTGLVDFSGLSSVTANLGSLTVGYATSGNATGTFKFAQTNIVTANAIVVGQGSVSDTANGTLVLGHSNTILTNQLTIGQSYASGSIQMPSGGTLNLGSNTQPTGLIVGDSTTYTDASFTGMLDLTGGTFNAFIGNLTVGERSGGGGVGSIIGTLLAGNSGSVVIGSFGSPTDVNVGRTLSGSSSTGLVDFSGLSSMTANLGSMTVGYATSGNATGTIKFAHTNVVTTNTILVGVGAVPDTANGTIILGQTNTILANQVIVGQSYATGLIQMPSGGTLNLGSNAQRPSVTIGDSNTYTDSSFTGKIDLSGGTLIASIGDLDVGERSGGGGVGTIIGTFLGGNNGSISIGTPASLANVHIGWSLTGPNATGIADFSGLNAMNASLNSLTVGYSTSGTANGTLQLPANNTISAATILIGGGTASASGTVSLGHSNSILVNQLSIAQDYANGSLTVPAGGSLTLGSLTQRANVSIAVGITNTANTYMPMMKKGGCCK